MREQQNFSVVLDDRGRQRTILVAAETRHRAADMAEKMNPGSTAVTVDNEPNVVGRCVRCESIVFADEKPTIDANFVRCFDCAKTG